MPPILTLLAEVGLICGVTFWQRGRLTKLRRVWDAVAIENENGPELARHRYEFAPLLAFFMFWLRCLAVVVALWLFSLTTSWSRIGSWDAAWNVFGVMVTLALGLGLGGGAWLFADCWQPLWQRCWADFKRPRPRPRSRRYLAETENAEARPFDDTVLDLPPYHELTPPTPESAVNWCRECERWVDLAHSHKEITV